jgi:hypothetical protein
LPALSLLGRIGTGPVLLVGARAQFTVGPPYGSGQLFLGINDDMVTDNAGAWTARITILSSSTQPPPPTTGVAIRTKKAVYAPNEPIVVEFSGFPATNDWITVVEPSAPASSYGQSIYTEKRRDGSLTFDGFAAGEYEARAYLNWPQGGYNIQARYAFTVENISTGVVLRTQKPVYAPSESIAVEFFGFPAALGAGFSAALDERSRDVERIRGTAQAMRMQPAAPMALMLLLLGCSGAQERDRAQERDLAWLGFVEDRVASKVAEAADGSDAHFRLTLVLDAPTEITSIHLTTRDENGLIVHAWDSADPKSYWLVLRDRGPHGQPEARAHARPVLGNGGRRAVRAAAPVVRRGSNAHDRGRAG